MTLTIDEGKILTKVANSCDRIIQVGTHQRSNTHFRLACELVGNGRIGKVTRVETRVGANPKQKYFNSSRVPEGLDWEFWLGQTPYVSYIKERCHYNFRWWYEYSGGKVTDWGAHHNDIAQWGLGADETGPVAVEAVSSGVGTSPNSYSCPTDFTITYTYADGVKLVCSATGKNGVKFIGENGWIFVDRAMSRRATRLDRRTPARERNAVGCLDRSHFELHRLRPQPGKADLRRQYRSSLGDGLPHRQHRDSHG